MRDARLVAPRAHGGLRQLTTIDPPIVTGRISPQSGTDLGLEGRTIAAPPAIATNRRTTRPALVGGGGLIGHDLDAGNDLRDDAHDRLEGFTAGRLPLLGVPDGDLDPWQSQVLPMKQVDLLHQRALLCRHPVDRGAPADGNERSAVLEVRSGRPRHLGELRCALGHHRERPVDRFEHDLRLVPWDLGEVVLRGHKDVRQTVEHAHRDLVRGLGDPLLDGAVGGLFFLAHDSPFSAAIRASARASAPSRCVMRSSIWLATLASSRSTLSCANTSVRRSREHDASTTSPASLSTISRHCPPVLPNTSFSLSVRPTETRTLMCRRRASSISPISVESFESNS